MIAADTSRSAAVVGDGGARRSAIGSRVREHVVVRASGRQRGSGGVRERVVVRAPGRQGRQRVNPRRS